MDFGDDHDGDDHQRRAGERSGSRDQQHHGSAERGDVPGRCADGNGRDAGIDRGNTEQSIDRQGLTQQFTATGTYSDGSDAEHHEQR